MKTLIVFAMLLIGCGDVSEMIKDSQMPKPGDNLTVSVEGIDRSTVQRALND